MSCGLTHHFKIGECVYCKVAALEAENLELKRDVARFDNSLLIASNTIKDLNAQINLLKTERSIRQEQQ